MAFMGRQALVKPVFQEGTPLTYHVWDLPQCQCVRELSLGEVLHVVPVLARFLIIILDRRVLATLIDAWDPHLWIFGVRQGKWLNLGPCAAWQPSHDHCKIAMLRHFGYARHRDTQGLISIVHLSRTSRDG